MNIRKYIVQYKVTLQKLLTHLIMGIDMKQLLEHIAKIIGCKY